MKEGQSFGELAILNRIQRTCSIKSVGHTVLLSLKRDVFLRVCGNITSDNIQKKVEFLQKTETFSELEETEINKIASCSEYKKVPGDTAIFKEG